MVPGCSRVHRRRTHRVAWTARARGAIDGWPSPPDYRFMPSTGQPPNVSRALFTPASGVRAYRVRRRFLRSAGPADGRPATGSRGIECRRGGRGGASHGAPEAAWSDSRTWFALAPVASRSCSKLRHRGIARRRRECPSRCFAKTGERLELLVGLVRRLPSTSRQSRSTGRLPAIPARPPTSSEPVRCRVLQASSARRSNGARPGGYPLSPPVPGLDVAPSAVRRLAHCAARRIASSSASVGALLRPRSTPLWRADSGWESAPHERGPPVLAAKPRSAGFHGRRAESGGLDCDWPRYRGLPTQSPAVGCSRGAPRDKLNWRYARFAGWRTARCACSRRRHGKGLLHVRTGGRPEAVAPLVKFCLEEIARMSQPRRPCHGRGSWRWPRGRSCSGRGRPLWTGLAPRVRPWLWSSCGVQPSWLLQWPEAVRSVTAQQVKQPRAHTCSQSHAHCDRWAHRGDSASAPSALAGGPDSLTSTATAPTASSDR